MQSNLQKVMYDTNNDRFVFDNDKIFQTLFKFQHSANLSHVNLHIIINFDFN